MGFILCAAAKRVGGDGYLWRIDNTEGYGDTPASYRDDSQIVRELVEVLADADAVVAHYGSRFDVPYLNTRAKWHQARDVPDMEVLPPVRVIDTWRTARGHLCLTSNRLSSLTDLMNVENPKYHLPWSDWQLAAYGDKKAMDALAEYCWNDVVGLEQTYVGMRDLIRNHPYVGVVTDLNSDSAECPACGSCITQNRGQRRTRAFVIKRHHCQNCGHWFDGKRTKVG